MAIVKRNHLFQTIILGINVSFQGCINIFDWHCATGIDPQYVLEVTLFLSGFLNWQSNAIQMPLLFPYQGSWLFDKQNFLHSRKYNTESQQLQ